MLESHWRFYYYGKEKIMDGQVIKFDEWCDLHAFNPDNDDNFNLYLVWVERETRGKNNE
jgi:tricorn protease-like protein